MNGVELKSARVEKGLTQSAMAEAMGLPLRTYEDIEAGRSEFRPVHHRAALKAFHDLALARPLTFTGPVVLVYRQVDRDGNAVGNGGKELIASQIDAWSKVAQELSHFTHTGFDEQNGYWWGRDDGPNFVLTRWWFEAPPQAAQS